MGGNESKTSQEVEFSPEALGVMGQELQDIVGRLDPIQRDQLMKYTATTIGQAGAPKTAPTLSMGDNLYTPVMKATTQGINQLKLPGAATVPIFEGLKTGKAQANAKAGQEARGVASSIPSYLDPRYAALLNPLVKSSTESGVDELSTGIAAAGAAAAIAVGVAAII